MPLSISITILIGGLIGLAAALALAAGISALRKGGDRPRPSYLSFALVGLIAGMAGGFVLDSSTAGGSEEGRRAYEQMPRIESMEAFRRQVLEADEPVLLDIYAPWCGPCKDLGPVLGDLALEYGDRVRFVKLNGDTELGKRIRRSYHFPGYPTVYLFYGGEDIAKWVGVQESDAYRDGLDRVLSVAFDRNERPNGRSPGDSAEAPQAPPGGAGEARQTPQGG